MDGVLSGVYRRPEERDQYQLPRLAANRTFTFPAGQACARRYAVQRDASLADDHNARQKETPLPRSIAPLEDASMPQHSVATSVETRASWIAAGVVLFIFTFSYGAPLVAVVALKPIAAELGSPRSIPALANSLAWLGSGTGALAFGWIAERIGIRATVVFGGAMIGCGLALASHGATSELLVGHGVLLGLLGGGAVNVPLIIYITRWFDRRRGSAVALVSSGQYIAGALWPPLIALGIAEIGWRGTMLVFGVASTIAVALGTLVLLKPTPPGDAAAEQNGVTSAHVSGLSPRATFVLLCVAGFLCCTPMAMPPAHLVALCSDFGIAPARGALMLSVLLGSAFISRQLWGWLSDTIGGLNTILAASICQAAALVGFVVTQDEAGLFAVSAAFGLGFSGIIPAYVLALRELYAAAEAAWRIPLWFFCNICGMAFGGWLAGYIYDQVGAYGPAFTLGVGLNLCNIAIIWLLAARRETRPSVIPKPATAQ
jgi:MFS family permease